MLTKVEIYTDGSCIRNPGGPGGWGAVLLFSDGYERELSGSEESTTSNRMEMTAALKALEFLVCPCSVVLYTDSKYLKLGMTAWLAGWKKRKWVRGNKPIPNSDLWILLDEASRKHTVKWRWVRGHSGNPGNERADFLARKACPPFGGFGSPQRGKPKPVTDRPPQGGIKPVTDRPSQREPSQRALDILREEPSKREPLQMDFSGF